MNNNSAETHTNGISPKNDVATRGQDIQHIVNEVAGMPSPTLSELDDKKYPQPNHLHQLLRLNNKTENSVSISGTNVHQSVSRIHAVHLINTQNLVESSREVSLHKIGEQRLSESLENEIPSNRAGGPKRGTQQKPPLQIPQVLPAVQENVVITTAKQYSANVKKRSMGTQSKPESLPGDVVQGKLFQINLREQNLGLRPAVVLKQSTGIPPSTSNGQRSYKVNNLYINANVHLNSEKTLNTNHFSSSATRKTLREQGISGIKSMKSSDQNSMSLPQSPMIGESQPTTSNNLYNRRLVTQRFTQRGVQGGFYHIDIQTLKMSETPRESALPRLQVKAHNHKRMKDASNIKLSDDYQHRMNTGLIIQEEHKHGRQRLLMHQLSVRNHNNTNSDQMAFDPNYRMQHMNTDIAQYTDGMGNQVQFRRDLTYRGPLIDFNTFQGLSDKQCIAKNSYNVVKTHHPHHSRGSTAVQNKAVFKVVSQATSINSRPGGMGGFFGDDSTENSIYKNKQADNRSNRLSSTLSEYENQYFYTDGRIKKKEETLEEHDGFKDYIMMPVYFQRLEKLKKRMQKRKKNPRAYQMNIRPEDFIILNSIYPRIYSLNNQLKGTIENPQIEFNPSQLTQQEIFMVKGASYLYTHEYQKAKYFIEQGQEAWPLKSFEFKFNLSLYHYLIKEYGQSASILVALLKSLEAEDINSNITLNRILSIVLNLMLSLIQDNHRYKDVLAIQHNHLYQRIRMMTNPVNLKIQKLLNYSSAQVLKQRAQSHNTNITAPHHGATGDGISSSFLRVPQQVDGHSDSKSELSDVSTHHLHSTGVSKMNSARKSANGSPIAERSKKKIKYQAFKKRGGQDFPLKNIQRLEGIRRQKMAERQKAQASKARGTLQSTALSSPRSSDGAQYRFAGLSSQPMSAREKFKHVLKANKAAFFKVENIQNVRSPDYVLTMSEIIGKLTNKEDIQRNKHLMYQLQKLEEVVTQKRRAHSTHHSAQGDATEGDVTGTSPMIPFPFELNDIQKKNPLYRDNHSRGGAADMKDHEKVIEQCIRNLEELRLEVSMEYGGEFEKIDPVYDHFKILCNSIYALLKEGNLLDILQDASKQQKQEGAVKMLSSKRVSLAKEILLSALLRPKKSRLNLKNQTDDQLVEIELLQEKISQLKEIMLEEHAQEKKKHVTIDYMQKIELQIKRLLVAARKKQKEREKQYKQEEEDKLLDPKTTDSLSPQTLIETVSLASLLKRARFQRIIAERFKVDIAVYMETITSKIGALKKFQKFKSGELTQQVLSKFKIVDPDQYRKLLQRTETFLRYLSDTFGGYFIANQTYCMTEFFELAPPNIKAYFDNTAATLTTIPMRLQSLAEAHDDNSWADLSSTEFIYNKDDIMHKFVSEGLRNPGVIEYMGLEKHQWIIEVTQKFNMLAVINQIFREAIRVCAFRTHNQNDEEEDDPEMIFAAAESHLKSEPLQPFLSKDSLNALKDQFARLKYQGTAFNTKLINKLIGNAIPMFKQFNVETRNRMFAKAHLKSIKVDQDEEEPLIINLKRLKCEHILVILNGNILVQEIEVEYQKQTIVEKYDKGRRVEVVIPPGPPIERWATRQVIGPGMAVPVQHLVWMVEKKPAIRLIANKDKSLLKGAGFSSLDIDYLEYNKKDLADLIFSQVSSTLVKKVELIQKVDIFNGESQGASQRLETLSPYVMFALAALCKVQVFNMCEILINQSEVPKAMLVILEGQAKAVFEDTLHRKGEVCPYSRRSIRTDLPRELKFGLKDFHSLPTRSKSSERGDKSAASLTNFEVIDFSSPIVVGGSKKNDVVKDAPSTTFQNLVQNQKWTEHQPTKNLKFKNHIEFGFLTEGQYVASRVVLDDGAIKNFIKSSKVKDWLHHNGKQNMRNSVTETMKSGFISTSVPIPEKAESEMESAASRASEEETQQQVQVEQSDYSTPAQTKTSLFGGGGIKLIQQKLAASFGTIKEGLNHRAQHGDEKELASLKQYLMSSQLSIIVTSATLKAMAIYKSDKGYFNEPIKKMITEVIQDKDFLDSDRPMEEAKNLDFIRSTQKEWEQFKYKFEEHSLRESFHQKYEQFPR